MIDAMGAGRNIKRIQLAAYVVFTYALIAGLSMRMILSAVLGYAKSAQNILSIHPKSMWAIENCSL